MTQKPKYIENRTDNIEILFNTLFYLQLLDDCQTEIDKFKKQIVREFEQFPIEFDKQKKAFRASYPYQYNENGIVTMFGNDYASMENVVLEPWSPGNRPETKEKKKVNRKPDYSQLLYNGQPLWFLQLIIHEGRKTITHQNYIKTRHIEYGNAYKKMRILDTLSEDERAPFESRDIDVENAILCRETLQLISPVFRNNSLFNTCKHPDYIPFFFLNDNEIEQLAEAIQYDNKVKKQNRYYYNNKMESVMDSIIHDTPAERVNLDIEHLFLMTKAVSAIDPQRAYLDVHGIDILEHETVWEKLHEQYVDLSDEHLHLLREFNLLNDELLQEIKDAKEVSEDGTSDATL